MLQSGFDFLNLFLELRVVGLSQSVRFEVFARALGHFAAVGALEVVLHLVAVEAVVAPLGEPSEGHESLEAVGSQVEVSAAVFEGENSVGVSQLLSINIEEGSPGGVVLFVDQVLGKGELMLLLVVGVELDLVPGRDGSELEARA